ncbi:hypothetical protein [Nostoc sp.]|uniref:hypothetical protein n=1 Tax=Nostoc sp. TaxID=1180 RepID=UPI002FFB9024
MLKIKHSQLNWLLAGITLAVMGVSIAPASAQRVRVIDGGYGVRRSCGAACRQTSPAAGSFIYGSPIPTPMPVDPATGLMPQRNNFPDSYYPQVRQRDSYYPQVRQRDSYYPQVRQRDSYFPQVKQPDSYYPQVKQPDSYYPQVRQPDSYFPQVRQPDSYFPR